MIKKRTALITIYTHMTKSDGTAVYHNFIHIIIQKAGVSAIFFKFFI